MVTEGTDRPVLREGAVVRLVRLGFGDPRAMVASRTLKSTAPRQGLAAGNRMPRTTVASMSTAAARPTPGVLVSTVGSVAGMENTATMITAAPVAPPALLEAEEAGGLPAGHGRMRLRGRP